MIKKIFCDVDGTLCNNQGDITPFTKEVIQKAKADGIDFVICTGRSFAGLTRLFEQYGSLLSCICNMGSEYYDKNGKLCYDLPISKESVAAICRISKSHISNGLGAFTSMRQFCDIPVEEFLYKSFGVDRIPDEGPVKDWFPDLNYFADTEELLKYPIYKMEFYTDTPQQAEILLKALSGLKDINPCLSDKTNIEICALGCSKGEMIRQICLLDSTSLDEVMTIGDSFNDLSMLEGFKYSVAMGNAPQQLKEYCHYTTDDNNHDGVGKIIEQVLLKQIQ